MERDDPESTRRPTSCETAPHCPNGSCLPRAGEGTGERSAKTPAELHPKCPTTRMLDRLADSRSSFSLPKPTDRTPCVRHYPSWRLRLPHHATNAPHPRPFSPWDAQPPHPPPPIVGRLTATISPPQPCLSPPPPPHRRATPPASPADTPAPSPLSPARRTYRPDSAAGSSDTDAPACR